MGMLADDEYTLTSEEENYEAAAGRQNRPSECGSRPALVLTLISAWMAATCTEFAVSLNFLGLGALRGRKVCTRQ